MTKPTKWHVSPAKTQISLGTAQSDQRVRYWHEESLGPYLLIECTVTTDQTAYAIVGFVMCQLAQIILLGWEKSYLELCLQSDQGLPF